MSLKEKVKLFEDFVSKQYSPVADSDRLSVWLKNLCKSVSTFSTRDILKTIIYLDSNKAYDHNMIIEILRIYDESQGIEILQNIEISFWSEKKSMWPLCKKLFLEIEKLTEQT